MMTGMTTDDVFQRQDALQAEAGAVHDDLGLERLAQWGNPVRVGSAALGMMVRRGSRPIGTTGPPAGLDHRAGDARSR